RQKETGLSLEFSPLPPPPVQQFVAARLPRHPPVLWQVSFTAGRKALTQWQITAWALGFLLPQNHCRQSSFQTPEVPREQLFLHRLLLRHSRPALQPSRAPSRPSSP